MGNVISDFTRRARFFRPDCQSVRKKPILRRSDNQSDTLLTGDPGKGNTHNKIERLTDIFYKYETTCTITHMPAAYSRRHRAGRSPKATKLSVRCSFRTLGGIFRKSSGGTANREAGTNREPRLPMAASGQRCRTQTISYHPRCNGRYHPEYPPDRGERRTLPFAVRSGGTKRHLLLLLPPLPSAKGIRILQWRIPSERKRTGCSLAGSRRVNPEKHSGQSGQSRVAAGLSTVFTRWKLPQRPGRKRTTSTGTKPPSTSLPKIAGSPSGCAATSPPNGWQTNRENCFGEKQPPMNTILSRSGFGQP